MTVVTYTRISTGDHRVKTGERASERSSRTPAYIRRIITSYSRPKAFVGISGEKHRNQIDCSFSSDRRRQ